MPVESPPFRIWLRRMSSLERTFALRFEAFEGKGVLRVARPGVLVDPPARVSGYESDITAQNVRSSRFLHVSGTARRRDTWFLSRLSDEQLNGLQRDTWAELSPVVDRGAHHLLLVEVELEDFGLMRLAEAEEYTDPESFTPYAAVEMMPAMPDALQPAYVEELVPLEAEEAPDTDEELLGDESSDGTVSPDDYLGGEEDELVTEGLLAAGLAQIALVAVAPAETHNGLALVAPGAPAVAIPAAPALAPLVVPATTPSVGGDAASPAPGPNATRGAISPNGLVRHLRRQLSAAQAEIIALNAKIALLERKILASEMAPIALEEDTDEA